MSLVLITVGIAFMLNPVVWAWDVLPDFIGAFLVILGIKKIVFLNENTDSLYSAMWHVAIISIVKTVVSVSLFGVSGGEKTIISIVFAALEGIYVSIAISRTFGMLDSLQSRYCDTSSEVEESRLGRINVVLIIYTVVRLVIGFLPEVTEILPNNKYGSVLNEGRYYPSDSKWALYILAAGITFVLMILPLVLLIRGAVKYGKDKTTPAAAVEAAQSDKAADIAVWYARRWKKVKAPLVSAFFFSIFLFFDGIDYLPKAVAAALFCILTVMHTTNIFERILAVVTNALLAAFSMILNFRLSAYFLQYTDESVTTWDDEAAADYRVVTILMIITVLLLFVSALLAVSVIRKEKLRQLEEIGHAKSEAKTFKRRITLFSLSLILPAAAGIAYQLLRPELPGLATILIPVTGIAVVMLSAFYVEFDIYGTFRSRKRADGNTEMDPKAKALYYYYWYGRK